ncbi:MAG: hypothetical protein HY268_02875 [Deltaproteobacteria bacterium]|nr:hypothetical protein [Deltaproteobacteria bacterium]
MATYSLTVQEIALLQQAAGMAGDRLARQENDTGARVMETLIAQLDTQPTSVWLNIAQREVLAKMLMNIAYDLIRANQDAEAETAEALAERLFQDEEDEQGGVQ